MGSETVPESSEPKLGQGLEVKSCAMAHTNPDRGSFLRGPLSHKFEIGVAGEWGEGQDKEITE